MYLLKGFPSRIPFAGEYCCQGAWNRICGNGFRPQVASGSTATYAKGFASSALIITLTRRLLLVFDETIHLFRLLLFGVFASSGIVVLTWQVVVAVPNPWAVVIGHCTPGSV
jgi:hypothetical protein